MARKRCAETICRVVCVLLMLPAVVRAEDERLPVKLRVAILFKALSYDQNLEKRCGGELRIGVIGLESDTGSMEIVRETVDEIRANAIHRVNGLPIHVEALGIDRVAAVKAAVEQKNLNALYLGPGLAGKMPGILRFARREKILVMSGEPGHVQAGVALGVVQRGRKPKIQIRTGAAKAQGAVFDARLLRLGEIIK